MHKRVKDTRRKSVAQSNDKMEKQMMKQGQLQTMSRCCRTLVYALGVFIVDPSPCDHKALHGHQDAHEALFKTEMHKIQIKQSKTNHA